MPYAWGDERRYNSYPRYAQEQFGKRVQKIAIDAGFTCPNRDGTFGTGGCTFCFNDAFSPSYCQSTHSITQQIDNGISFFLHRRPRIIKKEPLYLAYFQAHTNTYAPLPLLQSLYEEALHHPLIGGIVIATRPDCISDIFLEYMAELKKHTYVFLEIGVESCRDETLEHIHRGHTFHCASDAFARAAKYGIPTGAHLIFGLPGETEESLMEDIHIINSLSIQCIKFHQLQFFKGTAITNEYKEHPERFFRPSIEEYIQFIVQYLQHLRPNIVIERFAGTVPPQYLAISEWPSTRYDTIQKSIEWELARLNTWQGKLLI